MYQVLVVDDTVENIQILTGILKDEFGVKAATNGEMALKIAEKTRPDLVLLDIMMPGLDGYEVCERLKANPLTKNIPVIFVTAKDQELDEVRGLEVGAVDYINKPVNPGITKARIRTHLALSDQKKALQVEVALKTKEINETRLQIIKKLGQAAEYRDNDTGLHIERMSRYCYHMAKEYGFEEHEAELLLHASPMHDVGKIGVPDAVLRKPGKLDEEEWKHVLEHPRIGAEIIGDSDTELLITAKIVALQHHEKWNGKGYPLGLKEEQIHVLARVAAVADVFDALTTKRPYKEPWTVERAVALIESEKNEHFEPRAVEAFLRALPQILEVKEEFCD